MRPSRLLCLLLAALALAACARTLEPPLPPMTPDPATATLGLAPSEAPYTLDSGDKLRIVVFGQEGLSSSYTVDASGRISLALIGAVQARGLTPADLAKTIADRLRQGFIREPHVAVEIETYRPFFILGEVTAPGQYAYVPNMTAETAVAIAGGFTPRAQRGRVILYRNGPPAPFRNSVPIETQVRPGDTITVKERWF